MNLLLRLGKIVGGIRVPPGVAGNGAGNADVFKIQIIPAISVSQPRSVVSIFPAHILPKGFLRGLADVAAALPITEMEPLVRLPAADVIGNDVIGIYRMMHKIPDKGFHSLFRHPPPSLGKQRGHGGVEILLHLAVLLHIGFIDHHLPGMGFLPFPGAGAILADIEPHQHPCLGVVAQDHVQIPGKVVDALLTLFRHGSHLQNHREQVNTVLGGHFEFPLHNIQPMLKQGTAVKKHRGGHLIVDEQSRHAVYRTNVGLNHMGPFLPWCCLIEKSRVLCSGSSPGCRRRPGETARKR